LFAVLIAIGCEIPEGLLDPGEADDLPLGQMPDNKADGAWGLATTCKALPDRPPMQDPVITVSLNGLTLHLHDRATGVSKVYPVGVGEINEKKNELTYDNSLTLFPTLYTGNEEFTIDTASTNTCRIWWTDPDTGKKLPVFAGLPFLRFWGGYGIHGPITGYAQPNGGRLQRGYVSHGCVRMESADLGELWAYIKQTPDVPVRVRKAVERWDDGGAVDLAQRWLLSECTVDADCNYQGGTCKQNKLSGRGFCTAACDRTCSYDKYGYPVTFCVNDKDNAAQGYCTNKASDFNYSCRRHDGFVLRQGEPRFSQPSVKASVCVPGGQGWIGDRCLSNTDCMAGSSCHQSTPTSVGFCTESCDLYCPDLDGHAGTFCVDGLCRARCSEQANTTDCNLGSTCSKRSRHNQPWNTTTVCMPTP
jgi:hypothetical protein